MDTLFGLVVLFLAGVIAGAINSVAGGGSLISFPGLVAYGVPTVVANATNTGVVWPGTLSSAIAYRDDLTRERPLLLTLLVPSLIGGLLGAVILVSTPEETFAQIVPLLVLFATLLFATSDWFKRLSKTNGDDHIEQVNWASGLWGFGFQLLVATYGGYFGAGMGFLMLASLSMMGLSNVHRMNALKTVLGATINGVALVFFVVKGLIVWPVAITMAIGAIIGGYGGARLAKRINQRALRAFIVFIGLCVSAWLFVK
ncbi:MAG: sulfite exporter TauE/SafE family protein [Chloroflexi bacterium]|nr:sulfite exporter TauE/SafE family protein [Chloroflexota bacterium]